MTLRKLHFPAKRLMIVLLWLLTTEIAEAQPPAVVDGRDNRYCEACISIINGRPKEVLFGFSMDSQGDIYFSISDINWFHKIFKNDSYGVAVDIISRDIYNCKTDQATQDEELPFGTMLKPVYRDQLLAGAKSLQKNSLYTKVGRLPNALKGKEVEFNLMVMNGQYVCFYTNFLNIDRQQWALLPMGLYTDSLILLASTGPDGNELRLPHEAMLTFTVPFAKNSSMVQEQVLEKIVDSLDLRNYVVRRAEVRAYSSVEGSAELNKSLMEKRGREVLSYLQRKQIVHLEPTVSAMENWPEFYRSISTGKYASLGKLPQVEIKRRLLDPVVARDLEPVLATQRKAVVYLYVDKSNESTSLSDTLLVCRIQQAIDSLHMDEARRMLRELAMRIDAGGVDPKELERLEIPMAKSYASLLNDREMYRYMAKSMDEYALLQQLLEIKALDSLNGPVAYNICALRFFFWQYADDSLSKAVIWKEVEGLAVKGIPDVLVSRMKINYYILLCEDKEEALAYAEKDRAIDSIKAAFSKLALNDEDRYSLARFYAYYQRNELAESIVAPRISAPDVSENLLFFYINLVLFSPGRYDDPVFLQACRKATALNSERFCQLFNSLEKGGVGMQLLDDPILSELYCADCRQ